MRRSAVVPILVLLIIGARSEADYSLLSWRLTEFQPEMTAGGRANTIAVHPTNDNIMFVAAESGGLFKTTNRGTTWKHVDLMPNPRLNAVTFVPANPNILIVTANDDFHVTSGGGIWRSTDGGLNWTQSVVAAGVPRLSAFEISVAPDTGTIYAGTNAGVAISTDDGATWTHVAVPAPVLSIVAQTGGRVIAAGPNGIRYSTDSGATWRTATNNLGIFDIHALARSPFAATDAYVVDGATALYYTEDGGDHWTRINAAPGGGSCGGIAFVKAIGKTIVGAKPKMRRRSITLYEGNRCGLARMTTPLIRATTGFNYTGAWTGLAIDHTDTRDLAFTNGATKIPLLLAGDAGLHATADGGANWILKGGGSSGYNALQITEVRGQWIDNVPRYDLFFGTQDVNVWSSTNEGATWNLRECCEGFYIEAEHHVPTAQDSKITFTRCYGCEHRLSDAGMTNVRPWPDAPSVWGDPAIVQRSFHVQGINGGMNGLTKGLAVTTNLGAAWSQFASFGENRQDLPKTSNPGTVPVAYQAAQVGYDFARDFEIDQLVRIQKNATANSGTVAYPLMNHFGSIGIDPTMFVGYRVFAVDPANTQHIIAADVINEALMETLDGGDNWSAIPGVVSKVTNSGVYRFASSNVAFVSAISFSQDDPNLVALGTLQNGLFLSGDRGATWQKVPDSEQATLITSVAWRDARTAYVSTYGRGLWKLTGVLRLPPKDFAAVCRFCKFDPYYVMDRFIHAALAFNGAICGWKMSDRGVKELCLSPGASVVFFTDAKAVNIKVSERKGTTESPTLRGVAFDANWRPIGFASREEPLKMYEPTADEKNVDRRVGRAESPVAGKPYLSVDRTRITPQETLEVSGRSFPPNTMIELLVDEDVKAQVRVDEKGVFTAKLESPKDFGLHRVIARNAETHQPIDGTMFLVVHADSRR